MATKKSLKTSNSTRGKKTAKKPKLVIKYGFIKGLITVLLIGSVSFLLAKKYKNHFIVAVVDYTPISRYQLNRALNDRYGQQILNELINKTLSKELLKKNDISVSEDEVNNEVDKLKDRLGGEKMFKETLTQYGLSLDQLKEKLKITIGQKKLSQNLFNLKVSDKEVSDYFAQNKALFTDKTFEEVKEGIKTGLLEQKLQQEFAKWFTEQKQKASIRSFI